jgi:xanthine dehydrogenase YagR molybdenum-binding subunit
MSLTERSAPRIEAAEKVRGTARFSAEFPTEGLLHMALVGARIAHGRVLQVDASRARSVAGCIEVMTHENATPLRPSDFAMELQDRCVHFAGQTVAAVIGESFLVALQAAASIGVEYEVLPAVTALDQRLDHTFAPAIASRVATDSRRGDPEQALAAAEITVDGWYSTAANNHNALEPHVAIASWRDEQLTVHTTTQAVFGTRNLIARCFGLQREQVRVITQHLGGGFGAKGPAWFGHLMLTVMATRLTGRPVRLELTRAQLFTLVGRRQESRQRVRVGATRSGQLTAIIHDSVAQTAMFRDYADSHACISRWLYACPNVATTHRLARVNAPVAIAMRAPGYSTGSFALESALDDLAESLQLDPLELRLRNFAEADQHEGRPWSSNQLRECYRVAADAFGWERRPRASRSMREGHHLIGWGLGASGYPVYRMSSRARVRIERTGKACVQCCAQDMGTGTYTVLAQAAATILGLPLADITVEIGDTLLPEGPYSGAALATASFIPAVEEAAHALRTQLLQLAGKLYDIGVHELTLGGGSVRTLDGRYCEPLAQLLPRLPPEGKALEASALATAPTEAHYSSYGFGAVFAEVRVDADLGEVRVSRITAAFAAGRILNPLLARSQYVGGLIGGIGLALHEATLMDRRSGHLLNDNLSDYLVPVHADMPHMDVHMIEEVDPHLGSGIKGIGMLGAIGTASAIANAIYHATGRRIRELPVRLENLLT